MKDTGYHQVNFMADRVLNEMKAVQNTVLTALETANVPQHPSHQANALQGASTQQELIELVRQLQLEVKELKKTRTTKLPYKREITTKYCWTHGGCNHEGRDCRTPRRGHQVDATFENKMNGSNYYCEKL